MLYTPIFGDSREEIENFGLYYEGGGGLFDLRGGPSVVLEIFGKVLKISDFFGNFENFEILENYEF